MALSAFIFLHKMYYTKLNTIYKALNNFNLNCEKKVGYDLIHTINALKAI